MKLHATRKMKDGDRERSVPSFSFYAGRKNGQLQTTTNHCVATPLTLELAERLTTKLNANGMQAEVCDLLADPETVIYETLVDIGEEPSPQAQPLRSVAELTHAVDRCFQDSLTSLEILNLCCKAVLG